MLKVIESEIVFFAVADGIGGSKVGEIVSRKVLVNLKKGINKIELKLCCKSGIGTVASINIIGFKEMFGGSINHIWMVIVS